MSHQNDLTTSYLRKKTIHNHFELANLAINLAKDHIRNDEGKELGKLLQELEIVLETGREMSQPE